MKTLLADETTHKLATAWNPEIFHTDTLSQVDESDKIKSLGELQLFQDCDPNELLKSNFLRRGGTGLIVGPTGIGKSSLVLQMMILWSQGKAAFGIQPTRPLKLLLIQAENDDADVAEVRDGVIEWLDLSQDEIVTVYQNVFVCREDRSMGESFVGVLKESIQKCQPDIVFIDPILAYLGADSSSQKDVSIFLRGGLNRVLREHNCAAILIHHTNKPFRDNDSRNRPTGDSAYLGSGSAEWGNFARFVMTLQPIPTPHHFELKLGKRGKRAQWLSPQGEPCLTKLLCHGEGSKKTYWQELEVQKIGSSITNQDTKHTLVSLVPPGGILKVKLASEANAKGVAINKAKDLISQLIEERVFEERKEVKGQSRPKNYIYLTNKSEGANNHE